MRKERFEIINGKICERGKEISNERIVALLNESGYVHDDLCYTRNLYDNLKFSSEHFRHKCLRFENGIKDCIVKKRNLKEFAKEMGVI